MGSRRMRVRTVVIREWSKGEGETVRLFKTRVRQVERFRSL